MRIGIEGRRIESRNIQIVEAVAVVVTNGNTTAVTAESNPCGSSDIGEGAIVIIAIELCRVRGVRRIGGNVRSLNNIEIEPAVAVKVKDSDTGAHGFNQPEPPIGRAEVRDQETCRCGLVAKGGN